jgi:hypothetical protein
VRTADAQVRPSRIDVSDRGCRRIQDVRGEDRRGALQGRRGTHCAGHLGRVEERMHLHRGRQAEGVAKEGHLHPVHPATQHHLQLIRRTLEVFCFLVRSKLAICLIDVGPKRNSFGAQHGVPSTIQGYSRKMTSLAGKNATQNTFYKAFILFWYLKIKSGIQVSILHIFY